MGSSRASRVQKPVARASAPPPRSLSPQSLYLFGPGVDLTVIAGGLTFALLPLTLAAPVRFGQMGFLFLNFLVNFPHYMATNYRLYGSRAQIARYKVFTIHITALFVLTALLGHLVADTWIKMLYTLYFVWSPYHYTGQNYGIAMMYIRRGGVEVTNTDRRLLYAACMACFLSYLVYLNVNLTAGGISNIPLLRLGIPEGVARGLYLVLLTAGLVSGGMFLRGMVPRTTGRILLPALLLLASQFTWFALLAGISLFTGERWMRVETVLPAVAFLHCAQYLGVTAYYAKREQTAERGAFHLGRYFLIVILGGVVLWLGSARLLSELFAVDYSLSFLIMLTLINLHHFVMDGAIWKLRDGRIARLLVAPEATSARPPQPVGSRLPAGARIAAWACVVAGVVWLAGTDVFYRVLILQASELARSGQLDEARGLYQRVLNVNGRSVEAIDGLAYDALNAGHVDLAGERWQRSIKLNPTSAYARVGLGEVYLRLGRVDDAIAQLEKAVELAPDQPSGFMLLAMAQEKKGNPDLAQKLRIRANEITPSGSGPRVGNIY